jgi:RNA polymerase sigma-70 factor (ECF subfamily)
MPCPEQAILSDASPLTDSAQLEVEAVVREHSRLVFRIAYSVLHNHHDAEDVTQETFMRFLRARQGLAGLRDCRAYLARTAWRVAIARKKRVPEVSLEDAAEAALRLRSAGAPAEEIVGNRQVAALLQRLIESLPADLRQTLALSTVEQLSSTEIAELLGIPETSVRTRLLRARQLLRQKLAALLQRHPPNLSAEAKQRFANPGS